VLFHTGLDTSAAGADLTAELRDIRLQAFRTAFAAAPCANAADVESNRTAPMTNVGFSIISLRPNQDL
jgi:hypothetical protein